MKAFCPGHLTCFFQPVRSYDPLSAGSRGVGIKLSKGSLVTVEERRDQRIEVIMDGEPSDAVVTRLLLRMLAPERGFDVDIENQLPVSQGFGMSAAGAIAAGLCVCHMTGRKRSEAFRTAHLAEIEGGGGLGDVAALASEGDRPVRVMAGVPPLGKVVNMGGRTDLTLAVLGEPLSTRDVLADEDVLERIMDAGAKAVDGYIGSPTDRDLFRLSRAFSRSAGLETPRIADALDALKRNAGMCMLGNSIFTTLDVDETEDLLGPGASVMRCRSTPRVAGIIRKV